MCYSTMNLQSIMSINHHEDINLVVAEGFSGAHGVTVLACKVHRKDPQQPPCIQQDDKIGFQIYLLSCRYGASNPPAITVLEEGVNLSSWNIVVTVCCLLLTATWMSTAWALWNFKRNLCNLPAQANSSPSPSSFSSSPPSSSSSTSPSLYHLRVSLSFDSGWLHHELVQPASSLNPGISSYSHCHHMVIVII